MLFLLLAKKHSAVIFQYAEELIRYIHTGVPGLVPEMLYTSCFWNFLPFSK